MLRSMTILAFSFYKNAAATVYKNDRIWQSLKLTKMLFSPDDDEEVGCFRRRAKCTWIITKSR